MSFGLWLSILSHNFHLYVQVLECAHWLPWEFATVPGPLHFLSNFTRCCWTFGLLPRSYFPVGWQNSHVPIQHVLGCIFNSPCLYWYIFWFNLYCCYCFGDLFHPVQMTSCHSWFGYLCIFEVGSVLIPIVRARKILSLQGRKWVASGMQGAVAGSEFAAVPSADTLGHDAALFLPHQWHQRTLQDTTALLTLF